MFKINQFFEYHDTPETERLTIASFYMEGPALGWFQWMSKNALISSWTSFLHALEARFAPSEYDDPKGALFKLTQKGSVHDYLTEFETLANRIVGLAHCFLLGCFVSGLVPEVRREVQALQLISLTQAAALARLQEEKINESRRFSRSKGILPTPPSTHQSFKSPLTNTTKTSQPHFKRLTLSEMSLRREKGLCFNCDEKFSPGHKCASKFFVLIMEEDEHLESNNFEPKISLTHDPDPNSDQTQISFHALSGNLAPKTLRMMGRVST